MKSRRLKTAAALVIISVVLDFLMLRGNGEPDWLYFPGFFALFGLVGAIAVVFISSLLGRYMLERNEDYYQTKDDE